MKRVLFVATVVRTHISAFHIPYLQWFKEQGWETHVCARNDYEGQPCEIPFCDRYYDIPFVRSPLARENIRAYKKLKRVIEENGYDLIHCHTPVGGVLTRWAARGVRKRGTKVLYTAHGFHFYKGAPAVNWLLYYPVERFLARFTDVLITMNREDHVRAKRFAANRVEYIPGVGVDLDRFSGERSERAQVRERLGIPKDAVVLLSVGELIKRKDHSSAIKAMAQMENENLVYLICGSGVLKNRLTEQINSMGLEGRVHLLGFCREIEKLHQAADIFLFPSRQEGLPVALMEAMAGGLYCIATDIRGNRDLIRDGVNGALVPAGDTAAMQAALQKAKGDAELRRRAGRAAKETVAAFSLEQAKKAMGEIYTRAMGIH